MAEPKSGDASELNALGLPKHGDGVGPTLRPDLIAERERQDIEREVYERRTFATRELEGQLESRPTPQTSEAAGEDDRPLAAGPAEVDGENEQQCVRIAHARAQGGEDGSNA